MLIYIDNIGQLLFLFLFLSFVSVYICMFDCIIYVHAFSYHKLMGIHIGAYRIESYIR